LFPGSSTPVFTLIFFMDFFLLSRIANDIETPGWGRNCLT
jgi:hypothetical protein